MAVKRMDIPNFSPGVAFSCHLVIQGNTRVADIYLGELTRRFNHFYFRYHASRLRGALGVKSRERVFLRPDDSWIENATGPAR